MLVFTLNVLMFVLPAVISLIIHKYLRHGDLSLKKKLALFAVYFIITNVLTFCISYYRGVKDLNFSVMSLSYRLKYMGLGIILGFFMPFVICLLTEG